MTTHKPLCVILGGGGHARVLLDCLQSTGGGTACVILERDRARWGEELLGVPIRGDESLLGELVKDGARYFVVGVGGAGDNGPRQRLFELGRAAGLEPLTVMHPTAICSREARLGAGCQLLPGSIVNAGASLGSNVIVNSGAIVEHDCVIGDHAHIATGARLAGGVRVGDGAHVGMGACVRQGIQIGPRAIVGAGAVVVDDVADGVVVAGVPARPLQR